MKLRYFKIDAIPLNFDLIMTHHAAYKKFEQKPIYFPRHRNYF